METTLNGRKLDVVSIFVSSYTAECTHNAKEVTKQSTDQDISWKRC